MSYKTNNEYLRDISGDQSGQYKTNNEYLKIIAEKPEPEQIWTAGTTEMEEGDTLTAGHFYAQYEAADE